MNVLTLLTYGSANEPLTAAHDSFVGGSPRTARTSNVRIQSWRFGALGAKTSLGIILGLLRLVVYRARLAVVERRRLFRTWITS